MERELVLVHTDQGQTLELPLNEVFEARLEVDWKTVLNEGKRRR